MNFHHFDFSCNQPEWTVERTSAIIWCTERWMELATIWIGRCWVLLSDDTFDICHRDMTTMLGSLSVSSFRETLTRWFLDFLASLKATRPSSREANRVMLSSSQSVIHDKVGDFPNFQEKWKFNSSSTTWWCNGASLCLTTWRKQLYSPLHNAPLAVPSSPNVCRLSSMIRTRISRRNYTFRKIDFPKNVHLQGN